MDLDQSTHGTWNTRDLQAATGANCRSGSGPMSLTGQPNIWAAGRWAIWDPSLPGQRSVINPADWELVSNGGV